MKVLALLVAGLKNKPIAAGLSTTEQVVKNQLPGIYDKTESLTGRSWPCSQMHHRVMAAAAAEVNAEQQSRIARPRRPAPPRRQGLTSIDSISRSTTPA